MKIITLLSRSLLGLLFFVFGLNGFLHFIPMAPPQGIAGQYAEALAVSHYIVPVFLLEVAGGALLLVNRFVPLALILLEPVIVNILLYHFTMAPQGLPIALVAAALWIVVYLSVRRAFSGVFQMRQPSYENRN